MEGSGVSACVLVGITKSHQSQLEEPAASLSFFPSLLQHHQAAPPDIWRLLCLAGLQTGQGQRIAWAETGITKPQRPGYRRCVAGERWWVFWGFGSLPWLRLLLLVCCQGQAAPSVWACVVPQPLVPHGGRRTLEGLLCTESLVDKKGEGCSTLASAHHSPSSRRPLRPPPCSFPF